MSDNDTTPAETLLNLFVYAPLGLALEARELLPKLAERGKQQVTMARMLGQFAVQQGQSMAGDRLGQAQKQASGILGTLGLWPKPDHAEPAATTSRTAPGAAEPPREASDSSPTATAAAPEATSLAIPDYDSLSASQVVPRLDGLTPDELDAVRRYESAKRGRKTILGKIGQLQKSA